MAFTVEVGESAVVIELTGWDRLMNGIQQVIIEKSQIADAKVIERGALESSITHRALGCGTHNGAKRPNKRRIGTMLGNGLAGRQFWATAKGEGCDELLVLTLADHRFVRAVLVVPRPNEVARALTEESTIGR